MNESVSNGIKFWNDLSGQYKYSINGDEYTILFELTISQEIYDRDEIETPNNLNKINVIGNSIRKEYTFRSGVSGNTMHSRIIAYNPNLIDEYSLPHEIGHTLGMPDILTDGLMVSKRVNRSHNKVTQENINAMMNSEKGINIFVESQSIWTTIFKLLQR